MKGAIRWVAVAGMAAIILACPSMVSEPDPVLDPEPPPKPTLYGTWQKVTEWRDGDGDVITSTNRLVFSEGNKAFWHSTQFDLLGDDRHAPNGHIADWSATEDTITKTFIDWNDELDDWDTTPTTLDKAYFLSDSGDVLFVHSWESDGEEDTFERYTRVKDPVPANQTLVGTWQSVDGYWKDHVLVGTTTFTLTFTENRYIWFRVRRVGDEIVEDQLYVASGTWNATADSVNKTFVRRIRNDDYEIQRLEERSFDKDYSLAAGGELFIKYWTGNWENEDDERSPDIERYTRVTDPLPPIAGTWVWESTYEGEGEPTTWGTTITIGDVFTRQTHYERGAQTQTTTFTGSWRHDESKNLLFVAVQSANMEGTYRDGTEIPEEDVERFIAQHAGHELRVAYAPTGIRNTMMVSFPDAQQYDDDTDMWIDSKWWPHGSYHGLYERQGP